MILIPVIEETDALLGRATELTDKLEKSSYAVAQFSKDAVEFVKSLEDCAARYRLPIAGELALIRGRLICGEKTESGKGITRRERAARQQRFVLSQLEKAYETFSCYLTPMRKLTDECERLVCQAIVRITAKLPQIKNALPTGKELLRLCSHDEELAAVAMHVTGLIGTVNTEILFEKTMSHAGLYMKEEKQ